MKLIHLSDLHIGKRVNEVSMIPDQEYILLQILQIIDGEKPDAVLLCGDIYDKTVPSSEAVALFDDFLCRLSVRNIPVLIISGNHDSPERLAFGNRLMTDAGIHISPVYNGHISPITLTDDRGAVDFWLLPFLKPAHVKRFYPEEIIESYTDAIAVAISKMEIDPHRRNVLLTHQFVTGAVGCESEEIHVGGSENVDAGIFDDFDYVALGHIHGPQNMQGSRIRYCGTPLKYSFSEKDHHKSVTVVQLQEKGDLHVDVIPLIPKHDMRQLRGSFDELVAMAAGLGSHAQDYIHAVLTDEEDILEAFARLRQYYPNIMTLSYDNTRTRTTQQVDTVEDVQHKDPLTLFEELYEVQNNQPMSDTQRAFTRNLIQSIWEDTL